MILNKRLAFQKIMKVESKYQRNTTSIKWLDIYSNESELIKDLKEIIIPDDINVIYNLYKGHAYIHSFSKQLKMNKPLSDKQLTQAKRIALEIKKAHSIIECYE
jgi:hypothetical protein